METAGCLEYIKSRAEIKMVCVTQDDFSLDIFLEVSVIYALDRTFCTYRHEDRGLDLSMVSRDDAASCSGGRVGMWLYEFHSIQLSRQRY